MKKTISLALLAATIFSCTAAFADSKPIIWEQIFHQGKRTEYYDKNNKPVLTPDKTIQAKIKVVDKDMLADPDMVKNKVAYVIEMREFATDKPAFKPTAFFFYDAKDTLLHIEDIKDQTTMSPPFAQNTPPFNMWKKIVEKAGYKIEKSK